MNNLRVQINHTQNINAELLASHLYNEIGEEYDISQDDLEDAIEIENVYILPNNTFISIFTLEFPELEMRDAKPKDIIKSYLDTLANQEHVISLVKLHDDFLQATADQYFQKLFKIEMDLRNVLTYILTFDQKQIDKETFKNFGIKIAESYQENVVKQVHENGLYYLLFNHYASFSEAQKLKAEQIAEILQDVSLSDFNQFKERLQSRNITEDRHTQFLFSIKQKLKPLEEMRNAVMHIRNLSDNKIANFNKALDDTASGKGLTTLISDFWQAENEALKANTWLALATIELAKFQIAENEGVFSVQNGEPLADEELENLEDVKESIYEELIDRIEVNGYEPDCKAIIDTKIDEMLI